MWDKYFIAHIPSNTIWLVILIMLCILSIDFRIFCKLFGNFILLTLMFGVMLKFRWNFICYFVVELVYINIDVVMYKHPTKLKKFRIGITSKCNWTQWENKSLQYKKSLRQIISLVISTATNLRHIKFQHPYWHAKS